MLTLLDSSQTVLTVNCILRDIITCTCCWLLLRVCLIVDIRCTLSIFWGYDSFYCHLLSAFLMIVLFTLRCTLDTCPWFLTGTTYLRVRNYYLRLMMKSIWIWATWSPGKRWRVYVTWSNDWLSSALRVSCQMFLIEWCMMEMLIWYRHTCSSKCRIHSAWLLLLLVKYCWSKHLRLVRLLQLSLRRWVHSFLKMWWWIVSRMMLISTCSCLSLLMICIRRRVITRWNMMALTSTPWSSCRSCCRITSLEEPRRRVHSILIELACNLRWRVY